MCHGVSPTCRTETGNERSLSWSAFFPTEALPASAAITLAYPHCISSLDFLRTPLPECKSLVGSGYQQLCMDWLPHSPLNQAPGEPMARCKPRVRRQKRLGTKYAAVSICFSPTGYSSQDRKRLLRTLKQDSGLGGGSPSSPSKTRSIPPPSWGLGDCPRRIRRWTVRS